MTNQIFRLLVALFFFITTVCQLFSKTESVRIDREDGSQILFALDLKPVISVNDQGDIEINTETSSYVIPREDFAGFRMSSQPGGIDDVMAADVALQRNGDVVCLRNLPNSIPVTLCNVDGVVYQDVINRDDDCVEVGVAGLRQGVYILSVGSMSYKIVIK